MNSQQSRDSRRVAAAKPAFGGDGKPSGMSFGRSQALFRARETVGEMPLHKFGETIIVLTHPPLPLAYLARLQSSV